jgi:hypothetical protein
MSLPLPWFVISSPRLNRHIVLCASPRVVPRPQGVNSSPPNLGSSAGIKSLQRATPPSSSSFRPIGQNSCRIKRQLLTQLRLAIASFRA